MAIGISEGRTSSSFVVGGGGGGVETGVSLGVSVV